MSGGFGPLAVTLRTCCARLARCRSAVGCLRGERSVGPRSSPRASSWGGSFMGTRVRRARGTTTRDFGLAEHDLSLAWDGRTGGCVR